MFHVPVLLTKLARISQRITKKTKALPAIYAKRACFLCKFIFYVAITHIIPKVFHLSSIYYTSISQ